MILKVQHIKHSVFPKRTLIKLYENDITYYEVEGGPFGHILFDKAKNEVANIELDFHELSPSVVVTLHNKKWITLTRPRIILGYVVIKPIPDIVLIKRKVLSRSYFASFKDGWSMVSTIKPFRRYYLVSISEPEKTDEGLAFALAMDLAMKVYTSETP